MAIRWDKFTVKAQEAVQRANELASEHGNPELMPVHLLAALIEDKEGIVTPVLHLGLADSYLEHASREQLLSEAGLDAAGIRTAILKRWPQFAPAQAGLRNAV